MTRTEVYLALEKLHHVLDVCDGWDFSDDWGEEERKMLEHLTAKLEKGIGEEV